MWIVYSFFGDTEHAKTTWLFFSIYGARVAYLNVIYGTTQKRIKRRRLRRRNPFGAMSD